MKGNPEPPDTMTDSAKQIWRAFAPQYAVEIQDIPFFEQFCNAYASYRQLMQKVNAVGPLVTIKGEVVTNPNLTRADKEAANYKHALATMLRLRRGRQPDAEEDTDDTEADAFETLRHQITAFLTSAGEDDDGPAEDCEPDRDRTEAQTAPARRVRKKEETRGRPPKEEEP